jgi:predicted RecA/RadA family phage recombinase
MSGTVKLLQGGETVDYTPSSAVTAGDVVVQGEMVGVAVRDIAANDRGALFKTGNFVCPKATTSGSAITAGATLYWDASSEVVTTTSGSNKEFGKAIAAAAATASTVNVAKTF